MGNESYCRITDDLLCLGNKFLEMRFDKSNGNLMGLVNKLSNTEYIADPGGAIFYIWTLLGDKRRPPYANDTESYKVRYPNISSFKGFHTETTDEVSKLVIKHILLNSIHVVISLEVAKDSELINCFILVKNEFDNIHVGQVVAVGFPQLHGVRIGLRHEDDVLVRPNRFGEKISDPISKAGTYPTNICHCGYASMPWMDLYDKNGGLYVASYDKSLILTELESEPIIENNTIRLGLRKFAYVPPGDEWKSEPYVIGVHRGDWHWAADRYREWCESWMAKPVIPMWVKECDGWYGVGLHQENNSFRDIPAIFEEARYLGLNYVQFWGQMIGNSCCYRFYYPDPYRGGPEELKEGINYVKANGGHVGFYFNIQAFDPRLPELKEKYRDKIPPDVPIPDWINEFKKYAQLHFDGSYVRQYPGQTNASWSDGYRIMCLYCDGWQNYLLYWILEKYVKEYGANAVYVDQVSSPPVTYCFNFNHGHKHHGALVQGRVMFLKKLAEEARKIVPDFSITFEGNGDAVGQFGHMHLYTSFSTQTMYPCPEVFSYTFPDDIIIDGFANGWSEKILQSYYPEIKHRRWTEKDVLNRVFLLGYRFDLCLYRRLRKGEDFTEYARKVISLRRKSKNYLYNSKFMDDIGVEKIPKDIEVKVFKYKYDNISIVNILDNRDKTSGFEIILDCTKLGLNHVNKVKFCTIGYEKEMSYCKEDNLIKIAVLALENRIASIIFWSSK